MKKLKSILIFFTLIVLAFTGCAGNNSVPPPPDEVARLQSVDIIKCFENKDVENLKKMFCTKIISSDNLDKQIQQAFNFFDGKIVSYGNVTSSEGKSMKHGVVTEHDINPFIDNIRTNDNKIYTIKYYAYLVCDADKGREGISEISIKSDNGLECIIGDFYVVNPENQK